MKKYFMGVVLFLTFFVSAIHLMADTHTHTAITNECDCKKCECKKCECKDCKCEKCPGKEEQSSAHTGHGVTSSDPYTNIMNKMMADMEKVSTKTNLETNFLQQMLPHHQGAVEMAQEYLKNGTDKELIQFAKGIIVEQSVEIEKMNYLIGLNKMSKNKISREYLDSMNKTMLDMMKNMPMANSNSEIYFAQMMLPHHQAAIDMGKVLLVLDSELEVKNMAKKIMDDQQIEVDYMKTYLNKKIKN